jgi:hypothetical protein
LVFIYLNIINMSYNNNASYGALVARSLTPMTTWKTFYVTAAAWKSAQFLQDIFPVDSDWVVRVYSTIAGAIAACVAGRWDVIVLANDYTTAPTDTELTALATAWASIVSASNGVFEAAEMVATGWSKTLPATTTGTLFTITGVVEIIAIVWVVTTVIQAWACNLKLSTVSNAATTDICADLDIDGDLAQSRMSITWTFANAMINTAKWVPVARQATPIVVQEWTIIATTSATKTWAIRRSVLYRPLQAWSKVVPA